MTPFDRWYILKEYDDYFIFTPKLKYHSIFTVLKECDSVQISYNEKIVTPPYVYKGGKWIISSSCKAQGDI